ncbi:helix-turn-helix transcriptional regulator [Sinimarinibacterium thermocellulolyticum]|uniref:LuxR C-terminal-related transcriptional regulator n=1 Tax=Sinimarinibacterium thermocellulolyticum TaxID=3170016 RepID=A0ABV2AA29_9GAMM
MSASARPKPSVDSAATSARVLRERFRNAEGDAGRLRLLEATALAFAEESSLKSALAAALAQGLRFLTADCGLVLGQDGGALTVLAAHGEVLPVGARIPVGGVLAAVLRPSAQPSLREHIESRLRVGRSPEVAFELLLPLRQGGRAHGVLALMSERRRLAPTAEDLRALQALAALIATAIQHPAGPRPRLGKREASATLAQLSPREQQVLALLPRGLSNAEIAQQLGIATGTAKIHVERILHKLGVSDRTQAAVRATVWGFRA